MAFISMELNQIVELLKLSNPRLRNFCDPPIGKQKKIHQKGDTENFLYKTKKKTSDDIR